MTHFILGFAVGLFIGVAIAYLLGARAWNNQYNREKRSEKIKRELDIEERRERIFYSKTPTVYYNVKNGHATIVLDESIYHGYLLKGRACGTNIELTMVIDTKQAMRGER